MSLTALIISAVVFLVLLTMLTIFISIVGVLSINYLCNSKHINNNLHIKKPSNVLIKKQQSENYKPILFFFDFDQTITKEHVGQKFESETDIANNLREKDSLSKFIKERCEKGDIFAIVTFNMDKKKVKKYLRVLLGNDWSKYIQCIKCPADILGKNTKIALKQYFGLLLAGKNIFIKKAIADINYKRTQETKCKFSIEKDKDRMILVDDHQNNIKLAKSLEIKTLHVKEKENLVENLNKKVGELTTPPVKTSLLISPRV